MKLLALVAVLAVAAAHAAAATEVVLGSELEVSAAALSFNGTRCTCTVATFAEEGGHTSNFKVVSRCEKAFENSPAPETCDCQGIKSTCVVDPTVENGGLSIATGNAFLSGQCNHFCKTDEVSEGVCVHPEECRGAACPDKALNTKRLSTRRVTVGVSEECSSTEEVTTCTTPEVCHCDVSEPQRLTACTPTAQDPCAGTETFQREILQHPFNGGNACPAESELVTSHPCDVSCDRDCVVSAFGDFGACSTPCGEGTRVRRRDVMVNPRGNGAACPALEESEACQGQLCPANCTLSAWENGPCTASCGSGTFTRTRTVVVPAQNDGHCDAVLVETLPCVGLPQCPVDCVLSEFTAFTPCTATCGAATRSRSRTITTHPANGGVACGALLETVPCDQPECPVDCVASEFGEFGACSQPCGGGTRERHRVVITPAAHGGAACPALTETDACNSEPCQCQLGEWSAFSACSHECGPGTQTRTREVLSNPGNATCAMTVETQACQLRACPINCELGEFTPFSECSEVCGGGQRSRSRPVITAPQHNGTACGATVEVEPCNVEPCPVNCELGEFGEFGACSSACGGGTRTRTRPVVTPPQNGGRECDALVDTQPCNTQACANCTVGEWTAWSSCSAQCGAGSQRRNRTVTTPPQAGGHCDAALTETRECDAGPCPCDCTTGAWSAWTACTASCGEHGGTTSRFRNVTRPAVGKGHACPALSQTRPCNARPCDQQCLVSAFGAWGECSAACGGGVQTRHRTVTQPGVGSSADAACAPLSETRACNPAACPAPSDCVASGWSAWGACSKVCGGGVRSRTRAVTRNNTDGSACALQLRQEQPCATEPCSSSCETGAWSDWSDCSSKCGGGVQTRSRKVESAATNGGTACGAVDEVRECNVQSCGNYTGACPALPPKPAPCTPCCAAPVKHVECKCESHCSASSSTPAKGTTPTTTTTKVATATLVPVDASAAKASVKAAVMPKAAASAAAAAAPRSPKMVAARVVGSVLSPATF